MNTGGSCDLGTVAQGFAESQFDELVLAVVCALQLACLGAVYWQHRMRRRVEHQSRHQQVELAHAARLGIAGELTASVVHEINQPLGAILSNVDAALLLINRDPPPLDQILDILVNIREDDLRASDVILHLRALLSKRDIQLKPLSLNELVRGTSRIIGNLAIRHEVKVQTTLAADLPEVDGDWTHIQQVLINLAVNAMEAMADLPSASRMLSIRTLATSSETVTIEVEDRGAGIPLKLRPQVFDTYFSTKADGLGMGLAIVRNIVVAHGGRLEFQCPASGGTVFSVHLPVRAPCAVLRADDMQVTEELT